MFAKYYHDPLKGMKDRTLVGGDTLQDPNAGVDQTKITGTAFIVCFPKDQLLTMQQRWPHLQKEHTWSEDYVQLPTHRGSP